MSRCFPFPPPGYEKKIRIDDADSLTKEKQKKEKKHKREKKDKEKREGKEKKDKETSKDKHKERKEKKDKHKDRDKEKSRNSEERKAAGVLPNLGEKERLVTDTLQTNDNKESKFVEDLARRIRDEEKATESQSPRNFDLPGVSENNISSSVPQTNRAKADEKRSNAHRNAKQCENAVLQVSSCMDQKGADVMAKRGEKMDQEKKIEIQEKNQRKENVIRSDKPLDKEGIKKSEQKNVTNKSRKEEKTDVVNRTPTEKPKFIEGGPRLKERENNSTDSRNFKVQDLSKAGVKNVIAEGNLGKRKDVETNGMCHENGFRPNKIHRANASPIISTENGRKLGANQTHPKHVSDMQGAVCSVEAKERRTNGFIHSQELKSHSMVSTVKENGEASAKKRPHPDLKYLDQILNVPKREELNDIDDDEQSWLFDKSAVKLIKKPKADSSTSLDESPQVWNQAHMIDSADILALPYVTLF